MLFRSGARVDRRKVDRGQLLHVSVAYINTSSIEVRSVSIRGVLESIIMLPCSRTLIHKKVLVNMKVVELSGLVASNARADDQGSPVAAGRANDVQCIRDALEHGQTAIPIHIPNVSGTCCMSL